ncbi:protein HEAT INTOLERANT 4 isoform X2 [Eutrema salsugineum]|uniref:protein HEAT INTOLERANT 4 isoform X2 n=1 Tax=Eutrema salsugineum TaxID=72664 RepID=UPI000CED5C7F|nr:protein HEAT INTOLERANT 4 isoform X2 [Eutrema salsugineum]
MRKGTKRKGGSKALGKVSVAEIHNDVVMAESHANAEENEEDAMGVIDEEPNSLTPVDQEDEAKEISPRAKKARHEPEYLEEKRNLQDLWKAAFPVGTEWHNIDGVYDIDWDFKHLEEALEEGGMLYGKKVYVFGVAEPQSIHYKGAAKYAHVPTVVAVESPFPPSDKIGVTSVQSAAEKIIPMKQMKMDWVPYIPFEKRGSQVDRMNPQIFCLVCTQRRSALKHLKEDHFYDPLKEDELERSTVVDILFPSEPPVVCEFDWKDDKLEAFANDLIEGEEISEKQKDEFKEFVKEHVRAAKKARQEARAARLKRIEEMSQDDREAFQSIKFYKFYPQPSPDVSGFLKGPRINRYYGNAHRVL